MVAWTLAALLLSPVAGRADDLGDAPQQPAGETVARIELQREKVSSRHDRRQVETALAKQGVSEDAIVGFLHAAYNATLPRMASSPYVYLLFKRDPACLAMRSHFQDFLELPDVVTIDAATIRGLDDYDGVVKFPAVREISPEAATALAGCKAMLVFPNLERLSLETAQALAKHHRPWIVLGGLTTLDADVAATLSKVTSDENALFLPDLTVLDSVPLAKRLARQNHVFLPAVSRLAPEIARALSGNSPGELILPNLEELSPTAATQLIGAAYGSLTLGEAASLSPEAAAILAEYPGRLFFSGTEPFSVAAASAIAKHRGGLYVFDVRSLTVDVARALAQGEDYLILGVWSLTDDEATALDAHGGNIYFQHLDHLTPGAAAVLAPVLSKVCLPCLRSVDPDTAAVFAAHARGDLELQGIASLSPEAAAHLATYAGPLSLPNLKTLTPHTARALAGHHGTLSLDGLVHLDADVAAELARHKGGLSLGGVTELSDDVGPLLAATPGKLELNAVYDMTPKAAAAFLARTDPVGLGSLAGLESITSPVVAELLVKHFHNLTLESLWSLTGPEATDIARTLAEVRGTLALPMLWQISSKALEILADHPAIMLPHLADLEVVPDAAAGKSDDFVVPGR